MTIETIQLSQDFPDNFYTYRGIFVKQAIDSIADSGVTVELVSPKAYVLPFTWFPNHGFWQVPRTEKEKDGRYSIHHPRYLYPVPKRFLYRLAGPSYSYFIGNYIYKHLKKPQLLHSHFAYPDAYGMLKLVDSWKIPLVVHLRGAFRVATGEPTFKTIREKLLRVLTRADLIFTVSHSVKAEYVELGVAEEKMVVMPNGVNSSLFFPMDQDVARASLPGPLKDTEDRLLLFVGYLRKRKGVDHLMEAMPGILKEHGKTQLLFIGEGALRKPLERRSQELGISERVHFLSNIPHANMVSYINSADVVILPTLAEGRPNIILEAMLCGKAVVATAVSGIPELIRNEKEGLLIQPENPTQIRDAVCRVLEDDPLRERVGRQGSARIQELELDWSKYGGKVRREYEKLL